MKRKLCQYILALAILLGGYSCSFVDTINQTFHPEPKFKDRSRNYIQDFLSDSDAIAKAEKMFFELPQFTGKEINIYNAIHYYDDGRIILEVQSPNNPKHIDQYTFRQGKWLEPTPARSPTEKQLEEYLYPISDFSFTTAIDVVQVINEKSIQIGASPITHVYAVIRSSNIKWYPISIENAREKYNINFTETGELISFELD